MASAVTCSGCTAGLAVPAGAAGKVLRCPRCGTHNTIPGGPAPAPPRVRADLDRPARREPDWDDDPPPRRRAKGGVPGWAWAVAGSVVAVGAVVAVGLVLSRRPPAPVTGQPAPGDPAPDQPDLAHLASVGAAPETWESRTHTASGATWEFPSTGESFPRSSTVRFSDQSTLTFSVHIKDVSDRDKKTPVLHPLTRVRHALSRRASPFGPLDRNGTIDGRPAVVSRGPNHVALLTADWDREYEFTVSMPHRDEGEKRVKRFFDSVRITSPMPPEPGAPSPPGTLPGAAGDSGEVIPAGWDRVSVPRTKMTVLMPKGPPTHPRTTTGFEGSFPVARGLVTPTGQEFNVSACYIEAKATGPAIADPFGGVKDDQAVTAGGYPARLSYRVFGGLHMVHLTLDLGGLRFIYLVISGSQLDLNTPDVKRVLDSVSFTLPAKTGAAVPEDLNPLWTRRFAPGGTFSVEMPGPGGPASEAGVGLGPAVAWTSKGRLPLANRQQVLFATSALGIAGGGPPDPRKSIEQEIPHLAANPKGQQFVRRVEVGGRPGYVAARTDAAGTGHVKLRIQDRVMLYQLDVSGPGVTPDTPEVRRFFDGARFDLSPVTSPGPAGAPGGQRVVPLGPAPGAGTRP